MTLTKITLVSALALTVAACGTNRLESIRGAAPSGGAFEQGLHAGYVRLADLEYAEQDWADGGAFTERAALVSGGMAVDPEAMSARSLPADRVAILAGSRERLMNAFAAGGKEVAPKYAAEAQVAFDCWMQEQEENLQPDHIAACQADFIAAMEKLEAALKPAPEPAPAPAPAPEPAPLPEPEDVYFGFDSDKLDGNAMDAIRQSVEAFNAANASRIMLVGHADRSGNSAYNQKLSERRAQSVADALKAMGIASDKIRMSAVGEEILPVKTADGISDAGNRVVTIVIQ